MSGFGASTAIGVTAIGVTDSSSSPSPPILSDLFYYKTTRHDWLVTVPGLAMVFLVYRLTLLASSGATRYYVGTFKCPVRFLGDLAAALAWRAAEHTGDSSQRGSWWCFGCTLRGVPELVDVFDERGYGARLRELRRALRAELRAALEDQRSAERRDAARGGPWSSVVRTQEEEAALGELLLWPKKKLADATPWEFPPVGQTRKREDAKTRKRENAKRENAKTKVARRALLGLCFLCGAPGPSEGGHWALACPEPGFVAEPSARELASSHAGLPRPAPKAKAKAKARPKRAPSPQATGCGRSSRSLGVRFRAEAPPRAYGVRWRQASKGWKGSAGSPGSYFWYEPAPSGHRKGALVRRTLFVARTDAGGWRVYGTHPRGDIEIAPFDPLDAWSAVAAAGQAAEELAKQAGCTRRRSYKRARSPSSESD